jgi:NAD(P)-dependent dehydrogenase (short-subunit alcohol dehydrogenase family)
VSSWTVADAPGQSGRRVIVTGANSGLGTQIARGLAERGAHVVLACRSVERGEAAADRIRETAADASLEVSQLDLASLASVRAFAGRHDGEPLDLLVNNAGVMALPRRETEDGFEMHLGTNHLGHFALTGLLLPALAERPGARVVTMSSVAHATWRINFDDLHGERHYWRWAAYGQSKLANLLFAFELARRAALADIDLTSVAAHPGYASTNLQLQSPELEGSRLRRHAWSLSNRLFAQSGEAGARPALYAATMPGVIGGEYFGPSGGARGGPSRAPASPAARDPDRAARLWEESERLTGVSYRIDM